jgi:hypothetical protein
MSEGQQVEEYAQDTSKSKGHWVKCVNEAASDELRAHTSMFSPQRNSDYHVMVPRVRDLIVGWVDEGWYEGAGKVYQRHDETDASGGAGDLSEAEEDLLR